MGGRERGDRTAPDGGSREPYSRRKAAVAWIVSASIGWTLAVALAWAIAQMF